MRKYLSFIHFGIADALSTRGHVLYWVLVDVIAVGIMPFLWVAVVHSRGEPIAGFGVSELITYFIGSVMIWQLVVTYPFSFIIKDVQMGNLANDLIRPYSYFWKLFFFQIGHRIPRVLATLPLVVVILILFSRFIILPNDAKQFGMFFVSIFLAFSLIYCMHFLVGLVVFWFDEAQGVVDVFLTLFMLLSGDFAPITFFPSWLFSLASFLPFQYVINFPLQIYLGHVDVPTFFLEMSKALAWLLFFLVVYSIAWRKGLKIFTGVGR